MSRIGTESAYEVLARARELEKQGKFVEAQRVSQRTMFDIEMIRGFTNILMGGEGLFLATLTGPGRVWLHSLTPSKVAHRVAEYLPSKG